MDSKDDYNVISESIISEVPMKCPIYQCSGFMRIVVRERPKNLTYHEEYEGDEHTPGLVCTNCSARYKFVGFKKEKSLTNAQFMSQLLKQDVYCESGKLKHLVGDKVLGRYIKKLGM